MLLTQAFFQTFTRKPVNDPAKATEAIICLSLDSREQVDAHRRQGGGRRGEDANSTRATTASCTSTASKTPTATCGSSST